MTFSLYNFFSGAAVGVFIAITAMLGQPHGGLEYIAVATILSVLFGVLNCIWCAMSEQQAGYIAKPRQRRQVGMATYPQSRVRRALSAHRAR